MSVGERIIRRDANACVDCGSTKCCASVDQVNLWHSLRRVKADLEAERNGHEVTLDCLRNLLAAIHRDGGHHATAVGICQASEDAQAQVVGWLEMQDDLARAQEEIKTLCLAVRNFLETVATRAASPEGMATALEALLPDWKAPDGPALLVCDGWASDRIGEEQAENARLREALTALLRQTPCGPNYSTREQARAAAEAALAGEAPNA